MALSRPHHYDIYRDELALAYPGFGTALWNPSPGIYPPVEVGDVGFIRRGNFHRLFTALENKDHPSNSYCKPHYEPLLTNPGEIQHGLHAGPSTFESKGVSETSGGIQITVAG